MLEQAQVTEAALAGQRHAQPVGADPLAGVDEQAVDVTAGEPRVGERARDGLDGEVDGHAAGRKRHGCQTESDDRGLQR